MPKAMEEYTLIRKQTIHALKIKENPIKFRV